MDALNGIQESIEIKLPDELENIRVGDLIRDKDSEVHIQNGKITIRRVNDDSITCFEFSAYNSGRKKTSLSEVPVKCRKMEYEAEIKSMIKDGMKQKDIAFELGISPAYVSKLLNKKKN